MQIFYVETPDFRLVSLKVAWMSATKLTFWGSIEKVFSLIGNHQPQRL